MIDWLHYCTERRFPNYRGPPQLLLSAFFSSWSTSSLHTSKFVCLLLFRNFTIIFIFTESNTHTPKDQLYENTWKPLPESILTHKPYRTLEPWNLELGPLQLQLSKQTSKQTNNSKLHFLSFPYSTRSNLVQIKNNSNGFTRTSKTLRKFPSVCLSFQSLPTKYLGTLVSKNARWEAMKKWGPFKEKDSMAVLVLRQCLHILSTFYSPSHQSLWLSQRTYGERW